ncbi:MAG TPA: acyl-CoA thioesterase [Marinagarivorans sp.]
MSQPKKMISCRQVNGIAVLVATICHCNPIPPMISTNPSEHARDAFVFTLDFKVRDYECDLQGIVNNSVYQNYLEHTRHEYLQARGLSFAELTAQGIYLVVTRAELDYKKPLRSGDCFWVGLNHQEKSAARGIFEQQIFRTSDNKLVLNAQFTWASITPAGKPISAKAIFNQLSAPTA